MGGGLFFLGFRGWLNASSTQWKKWFRSMTYEQEVIFKCAIKGTIGGLQEKLTAEDFDELLNASQDWRKHLVIESITEVATIHAGRRRPEID